MTKARIGIEQHNLRSTKDVLYNLSVPALVEQAILHREGELTSLGAFRGLTGKRTGRSPRDKFVVRDAATEQTIAWGKVNAPISPEVFDRLHQKTLDHLAAQPVFVTDALACADPQYALPLRVIGTKAWHALFARQLFRRPTPEQLAEHRPEWVILSAPDLRADPASDGTQSEAFIVLHPARKTILIGGTSYAGEIKKSIFTVLNYVLPERGVFPMHCSANVGAAGDVALFFGLSGTGKTTLSADPDRRLIGDDEHGWSDRGVFNFEGGCYAKCIRLREELEPQIFNALRFGAVLENVVIGEGDRKVDFDDDRYTENTRAAYPVDFIANAIPEGYVNAHPRAIIFLTCDAFGVLPPLAKLTTQQAMYHFLSGYTARLAGTEAGVGSEPQAVFSTGFGEPFLPRSPMVYAKLLGERINRHQTACFLVNTGWTGGPYGVGSRIKLAATRRMIAAALEGRLTEVETIQDPIFNLYVPTRVAGVEPDLLIPRKRWTDSAAYDAQARELAHRFVKNFERFPDAPPEITGAGPRA